MGRIGRKLDSGVDGKFVHYVATGLTPGTWALFLILKDESDPAALISAFGPFKGTVYQTTLSTDFQDSPWRSLSREAQPIQFLVGLNIL